VLHQSAIFQKPLLDFFDLSGTWFSEYPICFWDAFSSSLFANKKPGTIRILSWNVNNFWSVAHSLDSARFDELLGFIASTHADIICFQDFDQWHWSNLDLSITNLKKYSGLTHLYFCDSLQNDGIAIFSRWPIIRQSNTSFGIPGSTDCLQWVDIATPAKTLRVFNTHLTSMNIHTPVTNHQSNPSFKFIDYDTAILLHSGKLRKLAYFDKIHQRQAALVKQSLDSCKGPFIFTADLNSVPSSYVYHHIRKGLKDAFLETGFGLGRTYDSLSPTLRIDVLLMSPTMEAVQYQSPNKHLSDHFPIIADIQFKH